VCALYWAGDKRVPRRTQSSIAVSVDGLRWVLLNCSPDILEQIRNTKALHPRAKRHSPIQSIILTNGDVDHIGGLLNLREKQGFTIFAGSEVLSQINDSAIFGVLDRAQVGLKDVRPNAAFSPVPDLQVEFFDVPGKVPLYREENDAPNIARDGNTFGLHLRSNGKHVAYVPGCGAIDDELLRELDDVDALFFDGTLFTDDEMLRSGTGSKTGLRMGHVSVSGEAGSIAALQTLRAKHKVFVHINNTNPMLIDDSEEQRYVKSRGWCVGYDGMELDL
jgi:pyrroloquinoline quinone biosynthesis protein B